MTLVSDIIQQGFRDANTIPIGASVSTNESAEGLKRLQVIISSMLGSEAGEKLQTLPVGSNGVNASWTVPTVPTWLPLNARVVTNLSAAQTLYLHPQPQDGSRVAVMDAGHNLATYNLILDGNGRTIENTTTVTLATNGMTREWLYREDLGNWSRVTTLATSDEMPFPVEFDDMFIILLAMRINPRNAQQTSQESIAMLEASRERFRARYSQTITTAADIAVRNMSRQTYPNGGFAGAGNINNGWMA